MSETKCPGDWTSDNDCCGLCAVRRNDHVGRVHVFERAGLGLKPFKCVGFEVMKYQACQGAPIQPGTCCDYCGTGIMNVFWIVSSDGRKFKVGCDCVYKTGDGGLVKEVKDRQRQHNRELRAARNARKAEERKARREALEPELRTAFLAKHPGLAEAFETDHEIIRDIKARFVQWCELSAAQVALVFKLAKEASEPKPVEVNVPAPVSDKRVTFVGTVVSVKLHEGQYGETLKATVKVQTPEGVWLAWGTLPAGCFTGNGSAKGCTVEITAKLVAGRDPHFVFMKRPHGQVIAMPWPRAA
jgi:hypothetical protein